ncbi:mitochondrial mRNA processing protein PET127, putative [Talaromyces marneffei ATCC 18224]|uniref:Mitochondrial mRNA processing protein PET127, putative n=1 Tax=Talaromyces marneffei (strain ATCC 18224 / CBS 334.59 / QM 7333) TaxID=441960 RepID=B6QVF3_TALMQ|nr:mitochondrial mRNA processing protein PET127, putative [Talaromyces marneffei ATCC 18224]
MEYGLFQSPSTSISNNASTADSNAPKSNSKAEPLTSDKISFSGVLTRDLFKVTNPAEPGEQREQPETAKRSKSKKKAKSEKLEEGEQGGETGENESTKKKSSKKKKSRKIKRTPGDIKSRMRKVPVKPRAKPPTLTARQAGKKPSRSKPARNPPGPPKPLNIEVSDTLVDGLQKEDIDFKALDYDTPPVPTLSFGLDRVLFNPGVYHLRDPRSRVYNFDPDLGTIMPVTEFDFKTLKEYITSSKDETLIELARKTKKKYVGSSSSMTSVLSHFHYLLSNWRPLKQDIISRGFEDSDRQFTRLLRGPSAMFLHYKDGVYAIDADKEFDSANILMNLGKSMEKQLTLPKEQFERYRRSAPNKITPEEENEVPESYHYSTLGDFVMRSQLDAYDPRLPGSGMFDLKTRAVVSIRMSVSDYEQGLGYEIRNRFGSFESFEREYYDMIRAAFLKYSLQVRIGRMDGIFVAFHNIERIFGFQYVPLSEMDYALHGQSDTELGDREFQYSIKLWNKILDKATAKYPQQSLRLHFETTESRPARMMVFVQPVTDDDIRAIQEKNKTKIEKAQQQMLYPETLTQEEEIDLEDDVVESETSEAIADADVAVAEARVGAENESIAADTTTIEKIESQPVLKTETGSIIDPTTTISTSELPSQPPQKDLPGLITALAKYIHNSRHIVDNITEILATTNQKGDTNKPALSPLTVLSEKIETSRKVVQSVKQKIDNILEEREAAYIRPKLFGMEIGIQNLVNNRVVDRPTNLKPTNDWKVVYTINEFKIGDGGLWNHFVGMRSRREKALSFEKRKSSDDHYILNLRRLAMQGKKFREEEDRIDKERGIVVYEELKGGDSAGSA